MKWLPVVELVAISCACLTTAACGDNRTEEERVLAASQDITNQRYRDAIIELRGVLQNNGSNAQARVALGTALFASGDGAAAEKEFLKARELGAPAAAYAEPWARILQSRNAHGEVLKDIEADTIDDPELASVLRALRARSMLALGSSAQAQEIFDAELAAGTSGEAQRISLLGKAAIAGNAGDIKNMESQIRRALEIAPNSIESVLALSALYLTQKKFDDVLELVDGVYKADSGLQPMDRFMLVAHRTEALLGLGDNEAAGAAAVTLRKLGKDHPLASYFGGRVELQSGNVDEAITHLQDVLARYPNFVKAQMLLGAALMQRNDFEEAEMFLSNVLAKEPNNVAARRLLAETRLRMKRPEAAIETIKEGLRNDDDNAELLTLLGRATVQLGERDAGVEYLQQVLENDPDNLSAKLSLAAAYVAQGDGTKAVEMLEALPAGAMDEKRRTILTIAASFDQLNSAAMEAQTDALLSTYPNDSFVTAIAGGFYAVAGLLDKARAQYEQLLKSGEDTRPAMMNILRIDQRTGDYTRSLELFESAYQTNSNDLTNILVLARIYLAQGDRDHAMQMVKKAYALNATALLPNLMLAGEALRLRDYAALEQYTAAAVNHHPNSAQAHALMGITQLRRTQFDAAIASFERAVQLDSGVFLYYYHLGHAQLANAQMARARESFVKALALQHDHLPSIRSLAILEVGAGNANRADELLRQAEELFGASDPAALELVGDIRAVQGKSNEALAAFARAQEVELSWPRAAKMYQLRDKNGMPDATKPLQAWIDATPTDATARLMLAQAYQRANNTDSAIEQYEAVIKLRPDSVLARNNVAWLYLEKAGHDSLTRARMQAEYAYKLARDNADVLDTYGWILLRSNQTEQAIQVLREAMQSTTPQASPDIAYHLAVALNQSGVGDEAKDLLNVALSSAGQFSARAEARQLFDTL